MSIITVRCTECSWTTDIETSSDTNPNHCPGCRGQFVDPNTGYLMWGNENETVAVTSKGIYLIQSIDWSEDREPEELSSIPSGMVILSWDLCQGDLKIPDSIL